MLPSLSQSVHSPEDADLDYSESPETQQTSYFDLSIENKKHLERLEQDFLNEIDSAMFIRSCLATVMFNSFNIALTLYGLHIGLGIWLAVIAGFSVGSVPGLKTISDSLNIQVEKAESNWSFTGINLNGVLLKGVAMTFLAGFLTFQAVSERRIVEDLSHRSYIEFQKDSARFENPKQVGLDQSFAYLLFAAGAVSVLWMLALLGKPRDL